MTVPNDLIEALKEASGRHEERFQMFMRAVLVIEQSGYEITKHITTPKEERRAEIMKLMESGVSFSEIRRTIGADPRTVKAINPQYKPFEVGGGGEAALVREVNRGLREFERTGKIGKNKDAGFNLRGGR